MIMVDPGRLRQRVTLQVEVSDSDGGGGRTNREWRDLLDGNVPAEVKPLGTYERLRAQQAGAILTHRVLIRYRPDVTAAMRLKYGDRTLKIMGVPIDLEERHQWLQIPVREEA